MKKTILLAILFAGLGFCEDPPYTRIDHDKPVNGLWKLEFDSEGYKDISSAECRLCQRILARGTFKGKTVGFDLLFRRNLLVHQDTTKDPIGFITIKSLGEESGSLLSALKTIWKIKSDKKKWKTLQDYPAFTASWRVFDFRLGKTDIILKNILGNETMMRVSVFKDKQTIWLEEVDKKYRSIFLGMISG